MSDQSKAFDKTINNYLNNIESLRSTFPTITGILNIQKTKSIKAHKEFLKNDCEYDSDNEYYLIKPAQNRKNTKLKKTATNSIIAQKIISRNFLVSAVSQFDTYIGELMRCVFLCRPDIIDNSERQLTYSELRTFSAIQDAREYIIEKEIESVLRGSHTEQFKWFENKLNLKLRKDLPAWKDFIELTQRRNLFVHNDAKISTQYVNVCKENKVTLTDEISIGKTLECNVEYFEKVFKCLFEIGFKLNQVIRRNLLPKELQFSDDSFLNITFELIHNKQYDLAKILYDFEDKYINSYSNQDLELRILLNRAQTYKWIGDNEKCKEIINSKDWSACGDLFKMASSVLIDDYESAVNSMKAIGNNEKIIDKAHYNDWPIFKEFVKTDNFQKAFSEIYGEEIESKEKENAAQQSV